jgi:hypothetical protein
VPIREYLTKAELAMTESEFAAHSSAKWKAVPHEQLAHNGYIWYADGEAERVLATSDCERCKVTARESLDGTARRKLSGPVQCAEVTA